MSFDLVAPHYTWMEAVLAGPRLQRCRTAWLDALANAETILVAGVGHGHFVKRCLAQFPRARLVCMDASAGMLERAQRRAHAVPGAAARLEFVHATMPEWRPPADTFDAIATHFFLDCFPATELGDVVARLAQAARPNAAWLLSDFAVPARGLARLRARLVHGMMYAFFRPVTRIRAHCVTEPDDLLAANGFTLAGRRTSEWGLLRSDWWRRDGAP